MFTHLCIEYGHESPVVLKYKLRNHSVTAKWVDKVLLAQSKYNIDDPARFYGFEKIEEQKADALSKINICIDTINSHRVIIDRKPLSVDDDDAMNYLHHIFEVYHGLLDTQTHEFYVSAPDNVKQALADLNVYVHRCEHASRYNIPKHVVTYYGLPKTDTLELTDYDLLSDYFSAGTVYLNYVEIGKTFEDLAIDNDEYIAEEAFKPYRYYSADFVIFFDNSDMDNIAIRRKLLKEYYHKNEDFFKVRGLDISHPYLKAGRIPLADLDTKIQNVVQLLSTKQFVNSVYFE